MDAAAGAAGTGAGRPHRALDRVADVAVVLVALAGGLLRDANRIGPLRRDGATDPPPYLLDLPWPVLVAAHLAGALVLLPRRRHPYLVGLALAALAVVTPVWAAGLAPYAVARWGARPWRSVGVSALVVVGLLVGSDLWQRLGSTTTTAGDPYTVLVVAAALTGFGLYFRERSDLVAQLLARAEAAERERGLLAERARSQERLRLATHLHDDVTRSATVVVLEAGALAVSAPSAPAREVAEQLRVAGARVLDDLQRLIRVLAGEPDVHVGGAVSLAAVVEASPGGARVHLDEVGDPGPVAPQVIRLVHDVVGEALLNSARHAPGAQVRVRVSWADPVEVRVRDAGGSPSPGTPGTGLGLRSLQDRCSAAGGQVAAGPVPGGFELRARVPATGAGSGEAVPVVTR